VVNQLDAEPRPSPAQVIRPRRWFLAIATAACTAAVLVSTRTAPPAITVGLILLATVGSIELSRREAKRPGDPRPVAWTIAGLYAVAVSLPTRFPTDIWSFTMVGRTVIAHHLNPYRVSPAQLGHDPMLHLLRHTWRGGTTPYGPLFVVHSAFIALISGEHPLLYRLSFQFSSALAVGIALWLIWRETRSTAAIALVGLNPVIAGSIVNGAHNDATVALGLLGAVLLLKHARIGAAGWVLAATVLLKISIGFAILPLALWTATRFGKRGLLYLFGPTICVAVPIMLLVPGAWHSMTNANGGVITRLTIWNIPLRVTSLGYTDVDPIRLASFGLLLVGALCLFGAVIARRQPDAGRGAAIGMAAWLVAAGYVLAWYTVMGLVVAALRPTDRIARWLAVQGGVITAAFLIPREWLATKPVVGHAIMYWIPIALLVGFVWALIPLVADANRLRRDERALKTRRTSPTPTA
jgi:hypothetical protein